MAELGRGTAERLLANLRDSCSVLIRRRPAVPLEVVLDNGLLAWRSRCVQEARSGVAARFPRRARLRPELPIPVEKRLASGRRRARTRRASELRLREEPSRIGSPRNTRRSISAQTIAGC
jgi:hypothetical protein